MDEHLFERIEVAVRERFIEHYLRDLFKGTPAAKGSPRIVTANIKQFFAEQAKLMGYSVSEGWLYDMTWYEENGYRRQTLVLESELHDAMTSDDFAKLVQARSDIRVWVAAIPNTGLVTQHLEDCKRQIREFEQSQRGDAYIFIIHDWQIGKVSVQTYRHS